MAEDIPTNKKEDFPVKFPIGPDPLCEEKLERILKEELIKWKIIQSPLPENPDIMKAELYREYVFADFDLVMEYMREVAVGCNVMPHHPRWVNTWTTLRVYLTTWDIKHIISYKDIMLARFMDKVYSKYDKGPQNKHTDLREGMEKEEFKSTIRELIADDELESLFEKLKVYLTLNAELPQKDELYLLSNRFTRIQKDKRQGRVDNDGLNREVRGIISDLLDILKLI